jgi:hypothetical protein
VGRNAADLKSALAAASEASFLDMQTLLNLIAYFTINLVAGGRWHGFSQQNAAARTSGGGVI